MIALQYTIDLFATFQRRRPNIPGKNARTWRLTCFIQVDSPPSARSTRMWCNTWRGTTRTRLTPARCWAKEGRRLVEPRLGRSSWSPQGVIAVRRAYARWWLFGRRVCWSTDCCMFGSGSVYIINTRRGAKDGDQYFMWFCIFWSFAYWESDWNDPDAVDRLLTTKLSGLFW